MYTRLFDYNNINGNNINGALIDKILEINRFCIFNINKKLRYKTVFIS